MHALLVCAAGRHCGHCGPSRYRDCVRTGRFPRCSRAAGRGARSVSGALNTSESPPGRALTDETRRDETTRRAGRPAACRRPRSPAAATALPRYRAPADRAASRPSPLGAKKTARIRSKLASLFGRRFGPSALAAGQARAGREAASSRG